MPGRTAGAGTKDGVTEFVELVLAYAKQETVDPVVKQVKALGKGVAGAALLAIGTVLLAIGFVRALQTEFGGAAATRFAPVPPGLAIRGLPRGLAIRGRVSVYAYPYGAFGHLSGDWSWVPYIGGALFCLAVAGFCVMRALRGGRR
jgi:hypothetical protein